MAKKQNKTKRSTDDLINSAIAQQNSWMENRRTFARSFLKSMNIFARPAPKPATDNATVAAINAEHNARQNNNSGLRAYWFPILCALVVIFLAVWMAVVNVTRTPTVVITPVETAPALTVADTEAPIETPIVYPDVPTFDLVRVERGGAIVIAGRWYADKNISVLVNDEIVATIRTDNNGEFVFAPSREFSAGNYTISLIGAEPETRSTDNVFVYVSPNGYEHSVSLLITSDGSTLMQAPKTLADGDLVISKIDYLDTGRIVVTGDALPRLRVSLALNDKYLGFARVSDHRHFGLGADVGELKSGETYVLTIRLHDGDGRTVAQVGHRFTMPEMTGDDNTFYTVRRGDCLWIIARNFLRRGVLFSIIAERNNIDNPDLIFPKQLLQIPTGGK